MEQLNSTLQGYPSKLKDADDMTLRGYVQMPRVVLFSKLLSDGDKIVHLLFLSFAWQQPIIPLTKPGIMIGSIFVVTLVMGDFITVRFMSGSQSANVGRLISNDVALLRYPSAAATSVVLLLTVILIIGIMLRFVNIRKEL